MEKIKTTKRSMRENYFILGVNYCSMQRILGYESPVAYSTRVEGWACDYYDIDGVVISEGYAPLKSKNMKADYELISEYEEKARELNTREEYRTLLSALLTKLKAV